MFQFSSGTSVYSKDEHEYSTAAVQTILVSPSYFLVLFVYDFRSKTTENSIFLEIQ